MLSDIVAGKTTTTTGNTQCVVMKLRDSLPKDEQEAFDSLYETQTLSDFHLMLRREGFHIGRESLTNHKKGTCICASS